MAERAKLINSRHKVERVADLRIYHAQLKRILESNLYFAEIKVGRKLLHKIGVTKRPIEERVIEIKRDLAAYYNKFEIKILETWKHRGNVELYFKHRYKEFNYKIGKLTEYFKFDEVETLLLDLHQMKPKILEQVELDILDGSLSFPLILQPDLI
jgi:hypothetical protein